MKRQLILLSASILLSTTAIGSQPPKELELTDQGSQLMISILDEARVPHHYEEGWTMYEHTMVGCLQWHRSTESLCTLAHSENQQFREIRLPGQVARRLNDLLIEISVIPSILNNGNSSHWSLQGVRCGEQGIEGHPETYRQRCVVRY